MGGLTLSFVLFVEQVLQKGSFFGRESRYLLQSFINHSSNLLEIAEFASPDVNVAIVNLPIPENQQPLSRLSLLQSSFDLLELVKGADGFSGILLDSFLEIGLGNIFFLFLSFCRNAFKMLRGNASLFQLLGCFLLV